MGKVKFLLNLEPETKEKLSRIAEMSDMSMSEIIRTALVRFLDSFEKEKEISNVFVDTTAWIALVNEDDPNHKHALGIFETTKSHAFFVTHSLISYKTGEWLKRNIGVKAARKFFYQWLPMSSILWVDEDTFNEGVFSFVNGSMDLVDAITMSFMMKAGIKKIFTYNPIFKEHGFEIILNENQKSSL